MLSRLAGLSLYWLARVGTRDATNSFKAYSTEFVREVGIESDAGFEIGIELVAKARRLRRPVAELPDDLARPRPGRLELQGGAVDPAVPAWYRFAFGPRAAARAGPSHPWRRIVTEQKVLVTGSSGFIGGYVVEELLAPRLRASSASTTTRSTARSRSPTTTTRGYTLDRRRRPRRRADDRAARRTATTSSPAPR